MPSCCRGHSIVTRRSVAHRPSSGSATVPQPSHPPTPTTQITFAGCPSFLVRSIVSQNGKEHAGWKNMLVRRGARELDGQEKRRRDAGRRRYRSSRGGLAGTRRDLTFETPYATLLGHCRAVFVPVRGMAHWVTCWAVGDIHTRRSDAEWTTP